MLTAPARVAESIDVLVASSARDPTSARDPPTMARMLRRAPFLLFASACPLVACGARSDLSLADLSGTASTSTSSPPSAQVASIAVGWDHSCALLTDGTAACWGFDGSGQLGIPYPSDPAEPHPAPVTLAAPTQIAALAGGYSHTCAVLQDGTLECWGDNSLGQSGTGTDDWQVPPTTIGSDALTVSAGFLCSCAVLQDGTATCWGNNDKGQLGDGTFMDRKTPVPVKGLSGAVAIVASDYHSCALLESGGIACWGYGAEGMLGDGTFDDSLTPVAVQGLPAPATQIALGSQHTCALLQGGAVVCWGYGGYGELGLGDGPDTVFVPVPTQVPGLPPAKAISARYIHTCALLEDGSVQCWGNDSLDMKGSRSPVPVAGISDAVAIASGLLHDCVLRADGRVVCWGENNTGQLGDGTTTPSDVPVTVVGLP